MFQEITKLLWKLYRKISILTKQERASLIIRLQFTFPFVFLNFTFYFLLIDLLSFEESKKIILRGDESEFYNLLNDIGFDIGEDISYQICTHRPMIDNTPVYTARWIGRERRDTAWMRSGWCSFDNRLEIVGLTDLWMQKELVNMSQTPNFTRMAIDHLKNNSGNPDVFDIKKGETL